MAPHATDSNGDSTPVNNGEVPLEPGVKVLEPDTKANLLAQGRMMTFPRPPKFDDKYKERDYMKGRLAAAFRIFGKYGFDEGVAGHITMRDPVQPDCFWVNPFGRAFSLMNKSDLIVRNTALHVLEYRLLMKQTASQPLRRSHRRWREPPPQHRGIYDPFRHPRRSSRRHLCRPQPFDLRPDVVFARPHY